MKTKKTIILLTILIIFISACTTGINSNGNSDSATASNKYRVGTSGIQMNYAANNPPSSITSTEGISVIVEYSNIGATAINDLIFYLTGYDPTVFNFGNSVVSASSPALPGKDHFNEQGSQKEFVTWKAGVSVPSGYDTFSQELSVTACYSYQTVASPTICVDPGTYGVSESQSCSFSVKDLGSSQGGPLAVTSLKQTTRDSKIRLELNIENKGGGTPYSNNLPTQNCYNSLQLNDVNTFSITEISLPGGRRFTCQPSGIIRLNGGKATVYCDLPLNSQSYFVSPLKIVLDYKYRQTLPKKSISISNYG
jgi:hypothetical protein